MRPSNALLGLLAAAFLTSLLAAFGLLPEHSGRIAAGTAFGLGIFDFVMVRRMRAPTASRRVRGTLPVNRVSDVELAIHAEVPRGTVISIDDMSTAGLERQGLPIDLRVDAPGDHRVTYGVRPLSRGEHGFAAVYMTIRSPLRLWERIVRSGAPQRVRVYPDFAVIAGYLALIPAKRFGTAGRLESHFAQAPPDFPGVPRRTRSTGVVPAGQRPPHAQPR
jgi:uncharacterized protein (DUF58 family)